ncbi:type 2 lanthipeptide synthetase LanM family protein [Dictyobacter formicarum]|uniref:Lanthionine synthetase n=1 Tax=Dictyobacter formicarum TaxID=2778368 RepID=A0ABQ3VQY7_9CHLR|nr:type 2 lanthipeptide synthetase LanM family protein [Dictyobacter formicarum]GHO88282.1 lanthionine synthetase [Dictyobacter formicarum]
MEKSILNEKEKAFWQAPGWYHALSLRERLASRQAETGDLSSTKKETVDKAIRRFRAWKAQKPFDHGTLFAKRLASDSLSEEEFLSLLAEPIESVQTRISTLPNWLATLRDAFTGTGAHAVEKMLALSQETLANQPLKVCLPAISPLLQRGLTSLQEGIHTLQQQYAFLPFDPQQFSQTFLDNIVPRLLFQMSKPVILEMHIARLRGLLQGETPEERFADFVRLLNQEEQMLPLLAKYPMLARQLATTLDQWTEYMCEFLAHLCADWQAICATFTPESNPGLLMEMQAGMGDRHRRGRSVLLLRFGSGMQLLYKPKPLAIDVHFQELLTWLNERGVQPRLRPLKLIDRGDYGWSEFVAASPCTSQDEVTRFYERQGRYLALLYALNAGDLHNENVIASGEHPMLVDLETLFHPCVDGDDPALRSNLAFQAMDQSVLQVGLLPRWAWPDKDSPGIDISGLGGQPGQTTPHPIFSWQETGTDQMRLVRERVEIEVSQNRPRLGDRDVEVLDYRDAIIAGFTRMYRLLCKHRDDLLTEQLPHFAHDEIRLIVRSTHLYSTLLFESFHPDLLRDALKRDRFFDHLWREVEHRPYLARIIAAEQQDLRRGDIPVFTTFPDSCTIFTSEREPVVDFFDTPSLELVKRQIQRLSEQDLTKQIWVIEASLATLLMGREDSIVRTLPIKPIQQPVKREHVLTLATAVGKRLEELALQHEEGAYWLGVNLIYEHAWSLLPTGIDLYNGTSGIALFLAYLGACTGKASFTLLARRSLASIRTQIDEQKKYSLDPGIGAFEGLGSVIYLLTHLGVLWNEPTLFQEAEELMEQLAALIPQDEQRDIINGSAGCILSLLCLYAVHPSPRILEIAMQCGDHLLATAQAMPEGTAWETLKKEPPLGGFSHGTAGIALSLLKLAAISGEERFRQTALAALTYDRSLFVPAQQNWADLRVFPSLTSDVKQPNEIPAEPSQKCLVAWCHGAPGIGLGRLGILEHDATTREEIDIALHTTITQGLTGNHSLCHGALGDVELLLTAAHLLNRPEDHAQLERAIALIVGSIEAYGWITGVPLSVETPGLMTGLAGIGYELLRLAEPDRVPSVLLLSPPIQGQ